MPVIVLKGQKREYMFSVVEADYDNMPEWGGIYIAVRANETGLEIKDCVAMGSCSSFKEYGKGIQAFIRGKSSTHLYLLPEFKKQHRQLAIEDLMSTEIFADIYLQMLENEKPKKKIGEEQATPPQTP